jgi:hypothetical protein
MKDSLVTAAKWGAVIFVIWMIITNPQGSAAFVRSVLGALQSVGNSLSVFFQSL